MIDFDKLVITIPANEGWDEANECFIKSKEQTITLKHSLISLTKWESKWNKPFLSNEEKTEEEMRDYIKCMTITQNVDPLCYYYLTPSNIEEINKYINSPMTATKFRDSKKTKFSRDVITNEIIYFWMISFNIPSDYATWHLNRLLTLIRVCNDKNTPAKKMSKKELMQRNSALNAERKKRLNSHG